MAESGAEAVSKLAAQEVLQKSFGKLLGTPVGLVATAVDFSVNPPSDDEIQNLKFWENWGSPSNDWRRHGERDFWVQ